MICLQVIIDSFCSDLSLAHRHDNGCPTSHHISTGKDSAFGGFHAGFIYLNDATFGGFKVSRGLRDQRAGALSDGNDSHIRRNVEIRAFDRYRLAASGGIRLSQLVLDTVQTPQAFLFSIK